MTSSKPGRSDIEEVLAKNPNTTTSSTTTTSYSVKNGNVGLAPSSNHTAHAFCIWYKLAHCSSDLLVDLVHNTSVEMFLDALCCACEQSEVLSDSL